MLNSQDISKKIFLKQGQGQSKNVKVADDPWPMFYEFKIEFTTSSDLWQYVATNDNMALFHTHGSLEAKCKMSYFATTVAIT